MPLRLVSALAIVLALPLVPVTSHARAPAAAAQTGASAPSALPPLPDQANPWLYVNSDVPRDKEWTFGKLANGLRWAVRANGVPPGQVSIRIRMDVGSMFEKPEEAGFAHLIEHLVFRQSKYLGQAQAIPTWQRLGATFGTDTNAETSPTQTVFKIDLPDATPASLDESMKLLSGMMIAPNLSESDIRTEVPIVLAEKRERGGQLERIADAMREVVGAGQPLGDHATIGSVAVLEAAHQEGVRAFHQRWYRPENAAIIISGDADPRLMAALIGKWFGDWQGVGPHVPVPSFGAPAAPAGADPANPVGETRVVVAPGQQRAITIATLRPWHEKNDTIVYNQGQMIDQVALAIINRRLEARARAGASFLQAQVGQENESRSLDGTFTAITPIDGDWRAALKAVRAVIADALDTPPSKEEIAREAAEINVVYVSQVEQRRLLPGARVADDLVGALDIHETVTSPEGMLEVYQKSLPLFTPEAVLEHTRKLFAGAVTRAIYVTPDAAEADAGALAAALRGKVAPDAHARPGSHAISFADLPPIGPAAPAPVSHPSGLLGIEELRFANGVSVQLWPAHDEPGRVGVRVRFGAGYRAFQPADAAYATLGTMALVGMGEGPLGQEELDSISTGRKMGFDFSIDDGNFQLSAETRAEDLADQLYLFAEKFAQPRWDAGPLARARAAALQQYDSLASSPQGVLNRDLKALQRGGDWRFGVPSKAALAAVDVAGFKARWAPVLAQGPIEVQIFGDFDRDKAVAALQRSFGALAPRGDLPAATPTQVGTARPTPTPIVLRHTGDANQAAAAVSWSTGGGLAGIRESRQLEVLSQVFSNRLLDAMREKEGASYAPQVSSDWPLDLANGGTMTALAQLQPDKVPDFFTTVDAIAADLAARPISADDLARVIEPLRQQIARATSGTAFFMGQVAGGTRDASRYAALRSLLADYTDVTPERLQQLAGQYLLPGRAWRLEVLPEGAKTR